MIITRVPIDSIVPDPANVRLHPEPNVDAITASLKRFGQAEPLIVQKGTRRLIAGHGRLMAMKKLGHTECDIVELDIENMDATALGIALNRTSDTSEFDETELAKVLEALKAEDALEGVGYSEEELNELTERLAKECEELDTSSQVGGLEFRVIVEGLTELQQGEIIERLTSEGIKCHALMS